MAVLESHPLLEQLMAARSGSGPDATALLSEHEDPRVRLLAQLWSKAEAEKASEPAAGEAGEEEPRSAESLRAELRLQRQMRSLLLEVEHLREVNDNLAAALGACYLCWGDDPDCAICRGRGVPGAGPPDPELFAHYVSPVIRRRRPALGKAPLRGAVIHPPMPDPSERRTE